MNSKKSPIAFVAILTAIMLVFGFTPIGYIPLPFAKITLMCLPVIIGTLVLGLRTGLVLSVVFILTSIAQLFMNPDAVSLLLFQAKPFVYLLCLVIPRLLIPFTTYGISRAMGGKWPRPALFVSSAVGSFTNTFLYLGMLQLFFVPVLASGLTLDTAGATAAIWAVVLTNGIPEAIAATLICPLVVMAVRKVVKKPVPPTIKKEISAE